MVGVVIVVMMFVRLELDAGVLVFGCLIIGVQSVVEVAFPFLRLVLYCHRIFGFR